MNEQEDFTPSLVAGLLRYRWRVVATVIAFALLGAAYAIVSWSPQATMSVVVQVSSGAAGQSNVDADRATSEVAAQLASPEVIAAAEELSGETIEEVSASASQGQSTVAVAVTAGSDAAAQSAANQLLPAYERVREAQAQSQLAARTQVIQTAIDDVDALIASTRAELAALPAGSTQAVPLQATLDQLITRRSQLGSDLDAAKVAATTPAAVVAIGAGPDSGPGRLSLLMRYVPAGIIVGLILSMLGVALAERRRPWLSDADTAGRVFRAPVIAVGGDRQTAETLAPVVGMAMLRAVGDADPGFALLVSDGPSHVGDGALELARGSEPVLERVGTSATVLSITAAGRAFVVEHDRIGAEVPGLWNELGNRAQLEKVLDSAGLLTDLVILVPVVDVEHEILLDLVLLSDACFVATANGVDLAPLLALRRDLDALGRRADGVVVGPAQGLAPA